MSLATAELPDDPAALRAFALACQSELKAAETAVQLKALEIEKLRFQIAKLRRMQFGRSSERITRQIAQLEFQLEELETSAAEDAARDEATEPAASASPRANKPKRKPLPDHLPREDVVHQPPGDGACICPECGAGWPNWARTSPRCWITWQGTSRSSVTCGQDSPVAIAVGTLITQRPRTEPSEPDSGTRLPRWVFDGKADTRPRVENTRAREPVVRQLANPLPVHRILLAPSPKRTMPQGGDIVAEGLQRVAVRRHRVVVEKASKPAPLLRDRLVHALPQFLLDLQELRPHSVPSGPPLEEEAPLSGCSADEGKPTKNLNFGAKSK
jgi:hypothetical protein